MVDNINQVDYCQWPDIISYLNQGYFILFLSGTYFTSSQTVRCYTGIMGAQLSLRSPWWSCNISCPVNYAASWQYKVCIKYCPMSQSQHQTRRQTGCLITLVKNIWCSSWKYLVSQSGSWTNVFSASTLMCLEITLFRKLLQRKMLSFRGNDINISI